MERTIFNNDLDPLSQGSTLVVGIDTNGNISRFNETLEHLTGKLKKDALDVPFASCFSQQIPQEELKQLLRQAKETPESVDIDTLFKTVTGVDVVVSWTGFPIKNEIDGRVSQLNLVGTQKSIPASSQLKSSSKSSSQKNHGSKKKSSSNEKQSKASIKTKSGKTQGEESSLTQSEPIPFSSDDSKKESFTSSKEGIQSTKKREKHSTKKQSSLHKKESTVTAEDSESYLKKKLIIFFSIKNKKIRIKRRPFLSRQKKPKEEPIVAREKTSSCSKDEKVVWEKIEAFTPSSVKKRFPTPFILKKTVRDDQDRLSPKGSLFSKTHKQTIPYQQEKKSDTSNGNEQSLQRMIKDLQKQNDQLQKQINILKRENQAAEQKKQELKKFFNTNFRFVKDSIGITKRREEFQSMMQQLSEQEKKMKKHEMDMILEKKKFKQKIEEFITWRKKLEQLEQEIEKRRNFLSEQEAFLNNQYDKVLSYELMQPASYTENPINAEEYKSTEESGIFEKEDLFNALTVEAVMLQRGRIKKANKLFAQMLGYSEEDLVGKHLVDFVSPNGLAGVEQHYMNRLKGVDDPSYKTVFLSKNEDEIVVKVHVKTTDFQGERVEIATFNEM